MDRRGWASGPVASRCGAIPKPLCFPSPPLCRPSSLFLFLFCCRFNFSSWTLSVLPERYLVFLLPVWHPPLSFFATPRVSPAGQGSTLSRSPEQRLVTVSTAPFCLVGGDFCPMNHPHPPLKGGLERGYWCFPVHRLLWGPLNLCCRPFHPGDTPSGLGPVEDPTQLHYSASFSVGLLIHFPKSGRAPWPPSVSPGSRPREPRGPTLPGAGGALAVSYGDAGRTHQDAATQGAILLELCFSPSFLGECWVGCGRAGSGG